MFTQSVDIANRAIQHVGARRITTMADLSKQGQEVNFCYDKLRTAELRRSVWRFATRRATLRPMTASMVVFNPPTYAAATAYVQGDIVQDASGVVWISMFASNTGNTPGVYVVGRPIQWWQQYFGSLYADTWSATATYNAGEIVVKTGPIFYLALTNGNINLDPATHASNWATLTGTSQLVPFFPMPVGVSMTVTVGSQSIARNLYPLPNGFMRLAAPDPKAASASVLAVSGGVPVTDWQLEGNYLVSASSAPIVLRFIADVSDVSIMEPLFCEGLSARIGYEVCETLTQSNTKLQAIGQSYQRFIRDARMVNAIEIGSTEGEEEEYELTRGPQGVVDGVPAAMSQPSGAGGATGG